MINTHVVSLPLALALRDANYPQENALFYWVEIGQQMPYQDIEFSGKYLLRHRDHLRNEFEESRDIVAAPLASELGEALPKEIHGCELTLMKHAKWHYGYCCIDSSERDLQRWECKVSADTEADARARLFLHLRKASLI